MPVITVNGPIGCGAATIGQMVAEKLRIDFVDRLVLTEASKLVRAPVGALIDKEQQVASFRKRLSQFMEMMLERSAISAEMYGGGGFGLSTAYESMLVERPANPAKLEDKDFIEATTTVVNGLCQKGDVVIIGRGANVILADTPNVLHVGLIAPLEVRAETLMRRENIERKEAKAFVEQLESANVTYFRKFFQVHPSEPSLYHTILNMGKLEPQKAADIISRAAESVDFARPVYAGTID
jgi:cytidylate kinase